MIVEPDADCAITPDGRRALETSQQAIAPTSARTNSGTVCPGTDAAPFRQNL
jgi:hypothetical protein